MNTFQKQTETQFENSSILEKEEFQKNANFIYQQWKAINIKGWNTKILDIGQGEPIIFVPIARGLEPFDSLIIQHFAKTYRVITFERREDENQILDRKSRANDIKQVLDYLNIKKAHFISHSSGSVATTTLALELPLLFLSYAWMSLSPKPVMDLVWWKKLAARLPHYIPFPDDMVAKILASTCAGGTTSLLYKRCYEQFMSVKKTEGVKRIKRWFKRNVWTLINYDWSIGLEKLTMPVLVMNSDDDPINSVQAMVMIEKQLPNSYGYKIVQGGRHFFQYTRSEQVIQFIEEFYARLKNENRFTPTNQKK